MYKVRVHFAPAHELVTSLDAFLYTANKGMDFGADWAAAVREQLGADVADSLRWATPVDPFSLTGLVWQCPGAPGPEEFLAWLSSLSLGQLYERLVPYIPPQKAEFLRDLGAWQSHVVQMLRVWHQGYFATVGDEVLGALRAEADRRQAQVGQVDPVTLVETATTGLVVENPALAEVLLIPQAHFRPLNRVSMCNHLLVCTYPVETAPATPGVPGDDLMRIVRALADENRLRILYYLADSQPRSFTDVMKYLGLAKNTVHYHLSALRTAGLVRFHVTDGSDSFLYTVRRAALDEIGPRLHRFLNEKTERYA